MDFTVKRRLNKVLRTSVNKANAERCEIYDRLESFYS